MSNDLTGTHVVIPTLSVSRFENIRNLVSTLTGLGASVSIVANGQGIYRALHEAGLPVTTAKRNLGFSGGVNLGANREAGWSWLLVLNDDVEISDPQSLMGLADIPNDDQCIMVTFGDEPHLPIPRVGEVVLSLSLLSGLRRRFTSHNRRSLTNNGKSGGSYFPFSMIAISRQLWGELGGLDERFPFTYEDADFTRRALALGLRQIQLPTEGITHLRSATGRSHIDAVLPAASWAAFQYLQKWSSGRRLSAAVCVAALGFRFILIPLSRASKGGHARGTARAISAILRNVEPQLPEYESW